MTLHDPDDVLSADEVAHSAGLVDDALEEMALDRMEREEHMRDGPPDDGKPEPSGFHHATDASLRHQGDLPAGPDIVERNEIARLAAANRERAEHWLWASRVLIREAGALDQTFRGRAREVKEISRQLRKRAREIEKGDS
jgi:hypothetical protein